MSNMNYNSHKKVPLLLCILDGYGLSDSIYGNAVKAANTPTLDNLFKTCPNSTLRTDGTHVGLPEGQMGNSEVGHMTIGAGRVVPQNLIQIQNDLNSGAFTALPTWQEIEAKAVGSRAIHLIGLVSDGGVHSHTDHLIGLCQNLNTLGKPIYIHAISDGRDTAPRDLTPQMQKFYAGIDGFENIYIVDLIGRFFAMDRDQRWERTERAYKLYTEREGTMSPTVNDAIHADDKDEFIPPICIRTEGHEPKVMDGDGIIFFNFRADRMKQIVRAFTEEGFTGFQRDVRPQLSFCASITEYDTDFNEKVSVFYPPKIPKNTLGEVVANAGKAQLRIAESEKYAHVTYFLDGGREVAWPKGEKVVIPSPNVETYDLKPEMSIEDLTGKLCAILKDNRHDLIVLNIANGDQVGHTGDFQAAIKALEAVDKALVPIMASLNFVGGEMILIADHGNCEEMMVSGGKPSTAHTTNPVPFIFKGRMTKGVQSGSLQDVAPTVLRLMGLEVPEEMEGQCLLTL